MLAKTLKGHSRLHEQEAVLTKSVRAGQTTIRSTLFLSPSICDHSASPGADAQRILIKTLLALADGGQRSSPWRATTTHLARSTAYRPLAGQSGITLIGQPRAADSGGVVTLPPEAPAKPSTWPCCPFCHSAGRFGPPTSWTETPSRSRQQLRPADPGIARPPQNRIHGGAVNLVMAHLTVSGAVHGGGACRANHLRVWVPASAFGTEPHYVALGHLHRRQTLPTLPGHLLRVAHLRRLR